MCQNWCSNTRNNIFFIPRIHLSPPLTTHSHPNWSQMGILSRDVKRLSGRPAVPHRFYVTKMPQNHLWCLVMFIHIHITWLDLGKACWCLVWFRHPGNQEKICDTLYYSSHNTNSDLLGDSHAFDPPLKPNPLFFLTPLVVKEFLRHSSVWKLSGQVYVAGTLKPLVAVFHTKVPSASKCGTKCCDKVPLLDAHWMRIAHNANQLMYTLVVWYASSC